MQRLMVDLTTGGSGDRLMLQLDSVEQEGL